MIVWKITFSTNDPDESLTKYAGTKGEAEKLAKDAGVRGAKPERIKIENRDDLAEALNNA
mgnify:CR=1 FL=1